MFSSLSQAKIVYSKQNTLYSINLKTLPAENKDGDNISYSPKQLGSTELFPLALRFSPNGRYFAVLSDKDFVISTSGVYRDSCVGSCSDLAWNTASDFIVKDGLNLKIYKNLKEETLFKPGFQFENVFSGAQFSLKTSDALYFYDFETQVFIRKIDVSPLNVIWSENKNYVSLICEESTYILKCNEKAIENFIEKVISSQKTEEFEEGCEEAFEMFMEIKDVIVTGFYFENVFIYLTNKNKLNYTIHDQIFSITTLSGNYFMLGFYQNTNKIFFMSKNFQLISYNFPISFISYQIHIINKDYQAAEKVIKIKLLLYFYNNNKYYLCVYY